MKRAKITTVILLSLTLGACGGSGDSSDQPQEPITEQQESIVTYQNIDGQLIAPIALAVSSRQATSVIKPRNVECPNVPSGYMPLNNASVELHNAAGELIDNAVTTDLCGKFTFVINENLVSNIENIIATKQGYKNIVSDIDNFIKSNAAKIVSAIESDADYEISGFQRTGDQSVNFIITDSKSNKAVIGLPSSAFTFSLDGNTLTNTSITGSQNTITNSTSVAITLDASGSMDSYVVDENGDDIIDPDGKLHTRYSLVAASAHQLIDMTKINDPDSEMAITLFSDDIYPMNDAVIADKLRLYDKDDNLITYSINSATGFIKDQPTLHTLIDLYNPSSEMYNPSSYYTAVTNRHADRVDEIASISYYPFDGATAFYDSIDSAIDQLVAANVVKPMIVALTDGGDNSSDVTADEVIAKANQYNIPVNIIGAGNGLSQSSIDTMKKIAVETGSAYFDVTNIADLGGFLAGISTRVTFNYDANLNTSLTSGEMLNITLKINDEAPLSRELLIP